MEKRVGRVIWLLERPIINFELLVVGKGWPWADLCLKELDFHSQAGSNLKSKKAPSRIVLILNLAQYQFFVFNRPIYVIW